MKKILLVLGLALASMGANAQLFLGGSIGFNTTTDKLDGEKQTTETNFSLAPEVGYSLNDRWDVGLGFMISTNKTKNHVADFEVKGTGWGIAPFVRYSAVEFGNFKVMGRADIGFGGYKVKDTDGTTFFGIGITPVLGYNLTDNFLLLANLNFLEIAFTSSNNKDTKEKTSEFVLGVDTNDVTNFGGNEGFLSIGFAYNF